ncbi:Uncharacterised protein [Candidatus Tiddalikarchaeum anstoanum]|nr:Uncharacterised protein [Candidatus Tiddalikarchaeum anstoanum]
MTSVTVSYTNIDFKTPKWVKKENIALLAFDISAILSKVIPKQMYFTGRYFPNEPLKTYFFKHHVILNKPTKISEYILLKQGYSNEFKKIDELLLRNITEKLESKNYILEKIESGSFDVMHTPGNLMANEVIKSHWEERKKIVDESLLI